MPQDSYSEEKTIVEDSSYKIGCKRFSVGVNILVAWVETDLYIACGFPLGSGIGGGTCMVVTEDFCNLINTKSQASNVVNIKNIVKDVDISKVEFVEITKSSTWTDEETHVKSSIKLGKYPVDKKGNFEIQIIETK